MNAHLCLLLLIFSISQACSNSSDTPVRSSKKKNAEFESSKDKDKGSEDATSDYDRDSDDQTNDDGIVKSKPGSSDKDETVQNPANPGGRDEEPVVKPNDQPCTSVDLGKVTKPEDFLCLGSRENVIANLPEILRSYFTLMRTSRSAQTAKFEFPRVILASPDGSMMFTVSTEKAGSKDIEIVVYDYKKNVWDFAGIDFSTSPPKVERESCKQCHGEEWHPIWPNYPNWPGAYVEHHLNPKADEIEMLNKMSRKEIDSPLLKLLKFKDSYKVSDKTRDAASGLKVEDEVNMMINIMAATKSGRKLASKIFADPKVTKADMNSLIAEVVCDVGKRPEDSATLKRLGYKPQDHFFHGIKGVDEKEFRYMNPDSGSATDTPAFFFGMVLLKDAVDKDATLGPKIPAIQKFFADPKYSLIMGDGISNFLKVTKEKGVSWMEFRGFYIDVYKEKTRPNQSTVTAECAAIKAHFK